MNPLRRRLLWLAAFAAVSVALAGRAEDKPQPKIVKLVVDYGDGVEKHFTRLPCLGTMTVMDAMEAARRSPHGITFQYTGQGETAFLTQIDDLKNEGGGGNKKNWLYRVNGKFATQSFGVQPLKRGDEVAWKFSGRGDDE